MTDAGLTDPEDVQRTVLGSTTVVLDPIRGSRFEVVLAPATSERAARAVVAARRAAHPDASHHCWACVLEDGTTRADDDGEPRDSAGAPILRHLLGAGLEDVVAVVTRWFGGTKLGRGGLVRAYGDATAAAIGAAVEAATIVTRPRVTTLVVTHPYDLTAPVEAVLASFDAVELDAAYTDVVERRVAVRRASAIPFTEALAEATAGRVRPARAPDGGP